MGKDIAALVHHICPCCGGKTEEQILLAKRLNYDMSQYNNKAVGLASNPCPKCQELIDQGVYFLVGVDIKKSELTRDGQGLKNPFLTGNIIGVSENLVDNMFNGQEFLKKHHWMFVEDEIVSHIKEDYEKIHGEIPNTLDKENGNN